MIFGIGTAVGVGLLKLLSDMYDTKYNDKWFKSLSDDELEAEREKVRLNYCASQTDAEATKNQNLLWKFDDVMRSRDPIDNDDYVYPPHREHGWYLPNDD